MRPWELVHEGEPGVDPAARALPPVYLDELFRKRLDSKLQRRRSTVEKRVAATQPLMRERLREKTDF
jgi:hypothetical protein